jgi:hypothetical protein
MILGLRLTVLGWRMGGKSSLGRMGAGREFGKKACSSGLVYLSNGILVISVLYLAVVKRYVWC